MNITQKMYEKYRLRWMIDHGHSLDELFASVTKYARECECISVDEIFSEWELNCGFNGEIWACIDEFATNEMRDPQAIAYFYDELDATRELAMIAAKADIFIDGDADKYFEMKYEDAGIIALVNASTSDEALAILGTHIERTLDFDIKNRILVEKGEPGKTYLEIWEGLILMPDEVMEVA